VGEEQGDDAGVMAMTARSCASIGGDKEAKGEQRTMKRSDASFVSGADVLYDSGCAAARGAQQRQQQLYDAGCTSNAAEVDRLRERETAV